MVVTRFAPSPTGRLHVGNIRTALVNWLLARQAGGRFILRLDDTDIERSEERFVEAIRDDLAWLGLQPDAEVRQSARLGLYEDAFDRLRAAGRIYACYESAEELEVKRQIQLSRGLPPIYDRAALGLDDARKAELEADGVTPHWRFLLDRDEHIAWTDLIRGEAHTEPSSLSDPVVRRADGSFLYMLPSVVDDVDLGITHVVRGEDHVTNSGVQLQMFRALGAEPPAFAHMALLTAAEGGKLSKRLGSASLDEFREAGIEPGAVAGLLSRIGTSQPPVAVTRAEELAEDFDLGTFSRAAARFDMEELKALNAKLMHGLDYAAVKARLPEGMSEAAWNVLRPNLTRIEEAAEWWQVVTGPVEPLADKEDAGFLARAAEMLPETLDADSWKAWTGKLKAETDRKGRTLFLPLRQALTGRDHGPDMAGLLPLIGREQALERLHLAAN